MRWWWLGLMLGLAGCGSSSPATEADGDTDGADGDAESAMMAVPLHTEGRNIVDATGATVMLAGFNWNGAEGPDYVPSGLDVSHRDDIAQKLHELGFNSIRLVWSNALVESNPVVDAGKLAANSDLIGKTALEVLDAVIDSLGRHGVMVILNDHISEAKWCCEVDDGNTLWYTDAYPESAWLQDWATMATRYKDVPAVIGADLRNEPRRFATWGDGLGEEFDWPSAAERGAKAIQPIAPNWLIIVEGVSFAAFLQFVKDRPIKLDVPGRLVYSMHDYPWFHVKSDSADSLREQWEIRWGYLLSAAEDLRAPVWLGEFGACNTCYNNGDFDQRWFDAMLGYVEKNKVSWSWWRLHGDCSWGLFSATTGEICSADLLKRQQEMARP